MSISDSEKILIAVYVVLGLCCLAAVIFGMTNAADKKAKLFKSEFKKYAFVLVLVLGITAPVLLRLITG